MQLKKGLTTGAVLLTLGATLAACGGKSASSKTTTNKTWSVMEGDVISTMDPSLSTDVISGQALVNTMEGLYRYNGSKLEPGLATSVVKPTNKGLTYTFHLRSSKWSNGTPITAKDFVYGWQRTVDPKTKSEYAYLYSGVKNADAIMAGKKAASTLGVKAVNNRTFQVTLEHAIPYFSTMMVNPTFFPQNQKFVTNQGKKYGTTSKAILADGPYKLVGWNGTDDSWKEVKNNKFWDAKDVHVTTINTKVIKDSSTALNLYNTHKLDDAKLNGQQAAQAMSNKDYKAIKQAATFYLEMNEKKDPVFKNAKVRQGISLALNRKEFVKKVLNDGSITADNATPKGLAADPKTGKDFSSEVSSKVKASTGYNLPKAKSLFKAGLKASGKSSLSISLLTDDTTASKQMAQYLQSALEKLPGMKVSIDAVPFKTRLSRSQNGQFDMVVTGWSADFPDPITFLDLFTSKNQYNDGKWQNASYDKLIQASKTTDAENVNKRWQDLLSAQELLTKQAGVVPIYQQVESHLVNKKMSNLTVSPNGMYNFVGADFK